MVCRDVITVLTRAEVVDEYGGSSIQFIPKRKIYANVRIFFSQNEDGLQNRQGLAHLEGSLYTRDKIDTDYFEYDGKIYHLTVRNPQAKYYLYKFRGVRHSAKGQMDNRR